MRIGILFHERSGYLFAKVRGNLNPLVARNALVIIRQRAMQMKEYRILVDATRLSAPHSELDRFDIGEAIAELIRSPMKLAAIYRAELINKFAENVAVNRGANFLICSSKDAALRWLLADSSDGAPGGKRN